ncbi:unnamed protein product [Prorocentrum cordatum]|uniref:SRPBCC family protein n=1 Tax=Prorocentrum cordatum TaxID=2364126 RepID=A0ABN9XXD2_9DINO|nr:unnamed protein product [Polarella glacialis]
MVGDGWREVASSPGANCRVQVTRPRTRVRMALDTAEQAEGGFELLSLRGAGVSGALPLFLEIGGWPGWYPFCRSARLLGEWCPQELAPGGGAAEAGSTAWGPSGGLSHAALWHLVFRLGPLLHIDTIGLAVERPGMLEERGELWHYVFSPEGPVRSGEGGACLGVGLPPLEKTSALLSLRVPLAWSRTAFEPLSRERGLVTFCGELVNLVPPGPFKWAIRLFWGTIANRAVRVMQKHISDFRGPLSADRIAFYEDLDCALNSHTNSDNI